MRGDTAQISEHTQFCGTIGKGELRRFTRIVWYRKGGDLNAANREWRVVIDQHDLERAAIAHGTRCLPQARGHVSAVGHPDRRAVFARETRHTTDMVAVLMGHDEGINIAWRKTRAFEPAFSFAQAETAIEQDARGSRALNGLHHESISFAARSQ